MSYSNKIAPLTAAILATLVVGCDGDSKDSQFLEPDQQVNRLTAYPQAFVLKTGDVQNVDLTSSVIAENIASWKLSALDDKSGLGQITAQAEQAFEYSTDTGGVGHINYTVSGDGLTSSSQVILAVNDGGTLGNKTPEAQNVTLSTTNTSDVSVDLRDYISDEDGDELQITSLISASNRFVIADDGYQVVFTPDGYVGIDQAVYSVDDGKGGYALAYILATAADPTAPNTPPVAKDDSLTMDVASQSVLNIDLNALISDVDGDTLMVEQLYSANNRAELTSSNNVRYIPNDFRGVDQITYRVTDNKGGEAFGTITITVSDSSIQPEVPAISAFPQTFNLEPGDSINVDVTQSVVATNIDSWALVKAEDSSGLGMVSGLTATSFDYLAQAPGVATINYDVQGGGVSDSSTMIALINTPPSPDNTPPTAKNVTADTTNDTSVSVDLSNEIADVDGDTLTISQLVSASGRFTLTGSQVTFKPDGFIGVDQAAYIVEDGQGGYASAYVVITSTDATPTTPNTPPTAADYSYVMDVASLPVWNFDLAALNLVADADGDALTIENIYSADGRAVKQGATGVTYTPGDFRGIDLITYSVSDGNGGSAIGSITVVVNDSTPGNTIPTANAVSTTMLDTDASKTISVASSVSDSDGDALEIVELQASIGTASINPSNPLEVIYAPKAGFVGEDRFVYIVSDGNGGFAMATISVTVNASNPTAPVANIVQVSTTPDAATVIDLSGYISDKETPTANLVISSVSTPTSPATLTQSGQNVTYTPNGFIGVDTLTYTVTDGTLSTTGYMVITVNPDDSHDLVANDVSRTTPAGSPITIDLSGEISSTDPTAGTLSIVSVVGATLGDVVVSGNTVTYTPKVGDYGQDAFVYNIKDSHDPAHYAQGLITVDITPPSGPEITTLTVSGTPTIGGTLSSNVACSTCNSSQYEYDWSINGITVATTPTYVYQSTDPDNNVRLKVTGVDIYGQETVEYSTYRVSVVKEIFANRQAFAALKNDGSVVTWGGGFGQDSSSVDLSSDVQTIYSNYVAFAAVKSDGSVVTWGQGVGGGDSSSVDFSSGVKEIYSSHYSFAALKNDGSMVAWKDAAQGGDSSSVDFTGGVISATAVGVGGYAALKSDGSVVSWGNNSDTSSVDFNGGVKQLFSNPYAFAAIKTDGSVVTWGNSFGGNSSSVDFTGGVKNIYSNERAFAAIKGDNSVVTWGDSGYGGNSTGVDFSGGVKTIYSTQAAFAALKLDGSVVTWGFNGYGGDSSGVDFSGGVKEIYSAGSSFAALKNDGSVVTWGYGPNGGDSSGVDLSSNVETIVSTITAFAALKNDGTVVTWGNSATGGDSSGVDFSGGVKAITSSGNYAFSALKNDGSVVTWGGTSDTPATAQPLITLVETSIP
ncbi:Ig-like domain-containing protein [Vibrio parahaemolyticus]|uniref:Ig-like domain-containing protein n=2 Tax=Vibrio parahaemolyticus TaxID=670 RepID=UPI00215D393F|nr:tandem-95 repeat protein [Vibrio parahaemolyticus]MCR9817367.1 tandem-95 repeat protein [Vibrio parahaemolyticus]